MAVAQGPLHPFIGTESHRHLCRQLLPLGFPRTRTGTLVPGPGVPSQPLHCELCVLGPVMEPLWASVSFPTSWSTHSPCMVRLKRDVRRGDSKHEVSVWKGTEMPCPWEGTRALALQGPRAPTAGKSPWSDPGPEGAFAGQGCSMEPEAPSRAPSGQPPLWPFPARYRGIQRSGLRALPLLTAFVQVSFWKGSQQ